MGLQSLHILYVEDDQDTLAASARLLEGDGHRVLAVPTLAAALLATQSEEAFDVLIADVGLPDGTPQKLLRELRAANPHRPPTCGIIVSGHSDEAHMDACRVAGFQEYLVKPIEWEALRAAIARCRPDTTLPAP
jgi:CheY-like chemotaxis protein